MVYSVTSATFFLNTPHLLNTVVNSIVRLFVCTSMRLSVCFNSFFTYLSTYSYIRCAFLLPTRFSISLNLLACGLIFYWFTLQNRNVSSHKIRVRYLSCWWVISCNIRCGPLQATLLPPSPPHAFFLCTFFIVFFIYFFLVCCHKNYGLTVTWPTVSIMPFCHSLHCFFSEHFKPFLFICFSYHFSPLTKW